MCTAIFDNKYGCFFGRTLDLECSYGEKVMRILKGDVLKFIYERELICKHSLLGMAYDAGSHPLFYDAINEQGLCAAALNFPNFAKYNEKDTKRRNLASFEVILYLLSQFESVNEAVSFLEGANITRDAFSPSLPPTPLHWMICDRERAVVLEQTAEGLRIFENEVGVMTNSPPFPYQTLNLSQFSSLSPADRENTLCPSVTLPHFSRGMGAFGLPGDASSTSRFVRAAYAKSHTRLHDAQNGGDGEINARAVRFIHILETVSQPYGFALTDKCEPIYTVYTSFMDMDRLEYGFFTYGHRLIRKFSFSDV